MKRKIYKYIIIIITAFVFVLSYNYYNENKKMKAIDENMYQMFKNRIDNIEFIVNGDKYILKIKEAKLSRQQLSGNAYFKKLKTNAIINYSVYKNNIENKNYIGSTSYYPHVRRDSLREQFYIDNTESAGTSDIGHIYESFIYLLHNKYHNNSKVDSGLSSFDESRIEYDDHGNLIKGGEVIYNMVINDKYKYRSIFFEESNNQKLVIEISGF